MSVVALCSAKGSPGVTTTALALAWVWPQVTGRRVLLVDADLAGSGIVPGYFRCAAPAGGGLLAVGATRDADLSRQVAEQALRLDESAQAMVLLGISEPGQAGGLEPLWPRLARACNTIGREGIDVLVDLGRLTRRQDANALLDAADLTVPVIRPSLGSVVSARPLLRDVKAYHGGLSLLVIGERGPYNPLEIGAALGMGSVLRIAHDADTARVFSAGEPMGWRFPRSRLVRSARAVVAQLVALISRAPAVAADAPPVGGSGVEQVRTP